MSLFSFLTQEQRDADERWTRMNAQCLANELLKIRKEDRPAALLRAMKIVAATEEAS